MGSDLDGRTASLDRRPAPLAVDAPPAASPALRAELRPLAAPVPDPRHLLAVVRYGEASPLAVADALQVVVPLRQLESPLVEYWTTREGAVQHWREGAAAFARTGSFLFGSLSLPACGPGLLEEATLSAYRQLLAVARDSAYLHLYRFWNCVPFINHEEEGLERYRRFCRARSLAFEEHYGSAFPSMLPSASAVGSTQEDLLVYFLAGAAPAHHVENPRQVSAWLYPPCYGPRSPSFARGTVLPLADGPLFFLSGTASIVGHETRHVGSLERQLTETVRNIAALVAPWANGVTGATGVTGARSMTGAQPPSGTRDSGAGLGRFSFLKTYLREGVDVARVRCQLEQLVGVGPQLLFLHADMCRSDLLLETEGVARL